jgi:hypothetical protein
MREFLNPIASHHAAPILAQLVACGWLGRAEALAAFLHSQAHARASPCGRRARIVTAAHEAPAASLARAEAAMTIRRALAPLLTNHASRSAIHRTAQDAAACHLTETEIELITATELARHLRARRRTTVPQTGEPS